MQLLESVKADKEAVNNAIEELIGKINTDFYTKSETDELLFRPEVYDSSLPETGKENVLYVLKLKNEDGSEYGEVFIFVNGAYHFLGTTAESVSPGDFNSLKEMVEELVSGTSGYVTYEEFVSGVNAVYETINEIASGVVDSFEYLNELNNVISGITDDVSAITSEISGITTGISALTENAVETECRIENIEGFLNDVASPVEFTVLTDRVAVLENKIENLMIKGLPETTLSGNITSPDELLISGPIETSSKVVAPSITIKNSSVFNNARLSLTAEEDILIKNISFEGDFSRGQGGNTVVSVNTPGDATIKCLSFETPDSGSTYNAVEIGLTKQPGNILFENCSYMNKRTNILIKRKLIN